MGLPVKEARGRGVKNTPPGCERALNIYSWKASPAVEFVTKTETAVAEVMTIESSATVAEERDTYLLV
jgi:hypothetical protein